MNKSKITPFLWFDQQAEEAAQLYVSIFKDSKMGKIARYNTEGAAAAGMPVGTAMTVAFEIEGQSFLALNGGPIFKFTEAVSFVVNCETQEELDGIWNKLSAIKESEQCGWCKDKYGLSWQIIPSRMGKLMSDPDPEKSKRVMHAMLQMKKIDIATLEAAYNGDTQAQVK